MANAGRDHAITIRHVEKDALQDFRVPTLSGLAWRIFGANYEVFFATWLIKWVAHIPGVGAMGWNLAITNRPI